MRSKDFCYQPENLGKISKNENSLPIMDYFVFSSVLGKCISKKLPRWPFWVAIL